MVATKDKDKDTSSSNNKKFKVAYFTFSIPHLTGQGHTSRLMAIRQSLMEMGLWKRIDFRVIGQLDNPGLWPEPDKYQEIPSALYGGSGQELSGPGAAAIQGLATNFISNYQPDLLLNDNTLSWIWPLLKTYTNKATGWKPEYLESRPAQVWHLQKYTPGLYRGAEPNCLDRLYEHEYFQPERWRSGICRQKTRSEGQKALGAANYKHESWAGAGSIPPVDFPAWEQADREVYPTYTMWEIERDNAQNRAVADAVSEWEWLHYQPDRKRIAPIVYLDPRKVLSRKAARQYFATEYGVDPSPDRAICLVLGRARTASGVSTAGFETWHEAAIVEANRQLAGQVKPALQVVYAGDCGPKHKDDPALEWAVNYMPGVDLVLTGAGYNTFYELRLLQQLDLWHGDGQAAFFPFLEEGQGDQHYRAKYASRLFSNTPGVSLYPPGNGADEIARQIGRQAGLIEKGAV